MNKIDKMLVKNYAVLVVADRLGDRIIPERLVEEVEIKVAEMIVDGLGEEE